ncbi:hypothetical protein [Nocardia sp. CDC160]|uniref:hypothetical protein n=1 Tax=Nocardia sp. CDC160 TaxID=3112166 RepID=UPI002DBF5BBF|nr:hypothetical protein [Nocardia sp. CDC160]MEC3916560.1 hypothetical protein [Nocardia sp. CDC160]
MKSRFTYPLAAVAVTAAALSTAGTATAAPVTLEPTAPVANSGSSLIPSGSSVPSGSGGSGSSNVLGTGSSASELINATLCTLQGKQWFPVVDLCL